MCKEETQILIEVKYNMGNTTNFQRVEKTKNFTVISNSLITSTTLTTDEKVIILHILTLPDDWVIYKDFFKKYYRGNISDGRIDKVWTGLQKKGYLTCVRAKRPDGKFTSWNYVVREIPLTDIPESDMSETSTVGITTSQEKGYIQSTNLKKTNIQKTNNIKINTILGEKENTIINIQKEENVQTKMQRDINFETLNRFFENTGIDWVKDINTLSIENFSTKYQNLAGDDNHRWLQDITSNYKRLNYSTL